MEFTTKVSILKKKKLNLQLKIIVKKGGNISNFFKAMLHFKTTVGKTCK